METGRILGLKDHLLSSMTWKCLQTSRILPFRPASAECIVHLKAHLEDRANYLLVLVGCVYRVDIYTRSFFLKNEVPTQRVELGVKGNEKMEVTATAN